MMNNEAQSQSRRKYNWMITIGIILIAWSLTPFLLAEFPIYYPGNFLYMFFLDSATKLFLWSPLIALITGFAIYKKHKLNAVQGKKGSSKLLGIIGLILAIIVLVTFVSWLVASMGV